jgi:hypothetical protein
VRFSPLCSNAATAAATSAGLRRRRSVCFAGLSMLPVHHPACALPEWIRSCGASLIITRAYSYPLPPGTGTSNAETLHLASCSMPLRCPDKLTCRCRDSIPASTPCAWMPLFARRAEPKPCLPDSFRCLRSPLALVFVHLSREKYLVLALNGCLAFDYQPRKMTRVIDVRTVLYGVDSWSLIFPRHQPRPKVCSPPPLVRLYDLDAQLLVCNLHSKFKDSSSQKAFYWRLLGRRIDAQSVLLCNRLGTV